MFRSLLSALSIPATLQEFRDIQVGGNQRLIAGVFFRRCLSIIGFADRRIEHGATWRSRHWSDVAAGVRNRWNAAALHTKARCNHRDPNLTLQAIVNHCTKDNIRVRVNCLVDNLSGLIDLVQRQVAAACNVEDNAACAIDRGFEQG